LRGACGEDGERKKRRLSAKDLKELGASPRVRRVIPPDGPQRVGLPKEEAKGHKLVQRRLVALGESGPSPTAGLPTMRARHSPDIRARATAALLVGERPAVVARDLGVPEGTVRSWKHRIKNGSYATLKKAGFGGLLMDHLEAMLRSLIGQSRAMREPRFLEQMPADELAVLFGTLFDRTMRMLDLAPAFWPRGRSRPPDGRGI
jgi:transposase-like protein